MAAIEETAEFDAIAYRRMALKCEADALHALGQVLNEGFAQAVDALLTARGKIVVSGMGKT